MQRPLLPLAAAIACATLLPACGIPAVEPAAVGSADGGAAHDLARPPNHPVAAPLAFALEPFDVAPGRERQVCKWVTIPEGPGLDVVRMRAVMDGVSHHFDAYRVLDSRGPIPAGREQVHDCAPAEGQLKGTWAIVLGSALPDYSVDTPPGVAYHFKPGDQIVLEQHVINAGRQPMKGGVRFELYDVADRAAIRHHADMIWMANWGFTIPAGAEVSDTAKCPIPYDIRVFALTSHTHRLGRKVTIDHLAGGADAARLFVNTDWEHPPYQSMEPHFGVTRGDAFQWTCTWKNDTDRPVGPGKDSTDEMCIVYAYAYPTASLDAPPIRCNVFF